MLTITKNGAVIIQAKDNRSNFIPTYESEKNKPASLFAYYPEDSKGQLDNELAN